MTGPAAPKLKVLPIGAPAPRFSVRSDVHDRFAFHSIAGRYIVLGFLGSAAAPHARAAIAAVEARRALFDDDNVMLFWVSGDPSDLSEGRLKGATPGIRVFWDFDLSVLRLWGLADASGPGAYAPMWFVLDPQLRVLMVAPMMGDAAPLMAFLEALPPPAEHGGGPVTAPVLMLPRVFEPEFCRELIAAYKAGQSYDSGFMQQVGGKTVLVSDHSHKHRRDVTLDNPDLERRARERITSRLFPEIQRSFQFKATHIERYMVARYDGDVGGHFKAHRDDSTTLTAYRRFAVTINLNAEDYEGGDLVFPEFGTRTYRAPTGGAAVFSCSLLHEARPVTRGVRFAFVPFLFDDAAAALQQANMHTLG